MRAYLAVLLVAPFLAGCVVASVAKTAIDVVSIPVKVVGKGIDAALPNQKRAYEERGRTLRREDQQRAIDERCQQGRPLGTDRCAPQPPAPIPR